MLFKVFYIPEKKIKLAVFSAGCILNVLLQLSKIFEKNCTGNIGAMQFSAVPNSGHRFKYFADSISDVNSYK